MKNMLVQLWHDERGFVQSTELILITVIAVIGLIVGLSVIRDSVTQELGDSAAAVGQVDQSYSIDVPGNGHGDSTTGTVITVMDDVVSLNRDFGSVQVTSTFNNFRYEDKSDVGDGQDIDGLAAAGIIIASPFAKSTYNEDKLPLAIPIP
ncbi:MAG: hypothetical protein COA78_07990 [Blastopirellula sp.]|nr:MAG: hypothetical protein COA78_07990 [Blastopirellula sp.]